MLMFDLDHFKSINDRFGHAAGDEVLRLFGHVVRASTRADDIIGRFGGEEFIAIVPGGLESATKIAERVRSGFEAAGATVADACRRRDRQHRRRDLLRPGHVDRRADRAGGRRALPRQARRPEPAPHCRGGNGRRASAPDRRRAPRRTPGDGRFSAVFAAQHSRLIGIARRMAVATSHLPYSLYHALMWRSRAHARRRHSLEVYAERAGAALACAYSNSAEFDAALIAARRAAGVYGPRRHRRQMLATAAGIAAGLAIVAFLIV